MEKTLSKVAIVIDCGSSTLELAKNRYENVVITFYRRFCLNRSYREDDNLYKKFLTPNNGAQRRGHSLIDSKMDR